MSQPVLLSLHTSASIHEVRKQGAPIKGGGGRHLKLWEPILKVSAVVAIKSSKFYHGSERPRSDSEETSGVALPVSLDSTPLISKRIIGSYYNICC